MNTPKEKVSYCIGLETARSLKQQFDDFDINLVISGFEDGLSNVNPKLSNDEVRNVLTALKKQIESQQKQFLTKLAQENKKDGEAFLAENKTKEGIITLNSGLQYKVLTSGQGQSPTLIDTVTVHYKGHFIDGRIFDSSYERQKPASFPVNRVIPGWSEILQKMKVGDKFQVFIPHYLAYGENGFGNEIGPNTTLIFEMELLEINSP